MAALAASLSLLALSARSRDVRADVTRYGLVSGRFVDRGVELAEVERASGHAVARVRLHDLAARVKAAPAPAARPEAPEAMAQRHEQERRQLEAAHAQERERQAPPPAPAARARARR